MVLYNSFRKTGVENGYDYIKIAEYIREDSNDKTILLESY